jgi:G:T-mismatch repair DNA endonuclease (very short patch repair protein)
MKNKRERRERFSEKMEEGLGKLKMVLGNVRLFIFLNDFCFWSEKKCILESD